MKLKDLRRTASGLGILPDQHVTIVSVQWFGSEALEYQIKNEVWFGKRSFTRLSEAGPFVDFSQPLETEIGLRNLVSMRAQRV